VRLVTRACGMPPTGLGLRQSTTPETRPLRSRSIATEAAGLASVSRFPDLLGVGARASGTLQPKREKP
jgi:hypothetical protein